MGYYKNFILSSYFPAGGLLVSTNEDIRKNIEFFKKYTPLDKVYIESHRGNDDVSLERMKEIKAIFEEYGIKTAGGITTTMGDKYGVRTKRSFGSFCYTQMNHILEEIAIRTASVFDEIIMDDFYFTNCTCDKCREEKGDRSWEEYRAEKMVEISDKYLVSPAKKVNPKVKMVIKYPNWYESFPQTGYNPKDQPKVFDSIFTGTETRDIALTDQNLPRYMSYSLMRWMENIAPGKNGGGWFDPYDCTTLDIYLEQAYLTVFSQAREVMMFCIPSLYDTVFIPSLGFQLEKLDALMDNVGKAYGVPVYIPIHSRGEDHLYNYLGMLGIPLEPVPDFPKDAKTVVLTADSACDESIVEKLKDFVANGGKAVVTSGFIKDTLGLGINELTSIELRDKKVLTGRYSVTGIPGGSWGKNYVDGKEIMIPVIEYRTNDTWANCLAISGDINFPMICTDDYGDGSLVTITVPENFSDLYKYPDELLLAIRSKVIGNQGIILDAPAKISVFLYDNDTFIIQSMREEPNQIKVFVPGKAKELVPINGKVSLKPLYSKGGYTVFELNTQAHRFSGYKIRL